MSGAERVSPRPSRAAIRDRVVELVRVRAGDLVPNPANWRSHPERQRRALRALLGEIGYADSLIARRVDGELVLIDGHLRKDMDPDQVVPVQVVDLDEREAELLLASLDPLAGLAVPDPDVLERLLERVQPPSAAIRDLLDDVSRSAGLALRRLRADPDSVPKASEPRTHPGDIWQLGHHRLLCGDATVPADVKRLMAGAQANVLWTDPPYGVDYVGKTPRAMTIAGDAPGGLAELLRRSFAALGPALAPGAAFYVCHPAGPVARDFWEALDTAGWQLRQGIVWVKDTMVLGHADYHYRHEPIAFGYLPDEVPRGRGRGGWHGGNDKDSVMEVPRPAASREHPTMKPVELVRRCLLNSSVEGDAVLDPFAGSGTTLIACEMLRRRGFALELDPSYCDVIVARWEEATGLEARLLETTSDLGRAPAEDAS